jgi:nucleoid-associated protein YgaU
MVGFLVDEVEEIVPADRIAFQPLKPQGPIDAFDAFALQGDRIMFRTSFERLFNARQIEGPRTAMADLARNATRETIAIPNPDARPAQTRPAPHSPGLPEPARRRPDPTADGAPQAKGAQGAHPLTPRNATGTAPQPGVRPAPHRRQPTDSGRDRHLSAKQAPRPARVSRLVIGAGLLLLLLASLAAGPRLLRWTAARRSSPPAAQPSAPVVSLPPNVAAPPGMPSTLPAAPSHSAEATTPAPGAAARATLPASPKAVKPRPTNPATAADIPKPESQEVLKVETEAFTLTVERPPDSARSAPPRLSRESSATSAEIRHVVVRGDTLWDIAAQYLGDPFQYPELARLSQIRNPDLIYPGDVIRIVRK